MLTCQFLMIAMPVIKRFQSVVLRWWHAAARLVYQVRFWRLDGEAEF